jgi:hypothetical protein
MALIAHVTFWIVLAVTAFHAGWRRALVFLGVWAAGYVASNWFGLVGTFLFGSFVAVLDLVMLFLLRQDT